MALCVPALRAFQTAVRSRYEYRGGVLLSGRRFLVESVLALQTELRARKSDLLVRFGEPERVLAGLVGHLREQDDADIEVFCQKEVRAYCFVSSCGREG
jgi:hypothetical protein